MVEDRLLDSPTIPSGVSSSRPILCPPPIQHPPRYLRIRPPPARLRPGTLPPPPAPPPGTVSRGDGLDLHAHRSPTGPASEGPRCCPDPGSAPALARLALRLASPPPLQSRRRCGGSRDLRGEGPRGRGRRGGAARKGGVDWGGARGKGP